MSKAPGKNIFLSMSLGGHAVLKSLLKKHKKIDQIITLPKESSENVSDYIDFTPLAREYQIPITYTEYINRLLPEFQKNRPNTIFVMGWSQLLKKDLIDTAVNGCVGEHPALLPKNRGRAPVAWHFINREKFGGQSIFYLDEGCDSGPIIAQKKFLITPKDNASSYYQKATNFLVEMILKKFDLIVSGKARSKKQDHRKATYLLKRRPQDSRINFFASARQIYDLVRAVSDIYPLGNFMYDGKKYLVRKSMLVTKTPKYSGQPGQVAKVADQELWVLAGDGHLISFQDVLNESRVPVPLRSVFRQGVVFNETE